MRKVLKYLGYAALLVILPVIGLLLVPLAIAGLWLIVFAVLSPFDGALDGLSRSEAAIAALEATRLSAYTEHAPYHYMTVDDCMTIFEIAEYDNHVDNTDLRAGLIALAAGTDGWHVESVSAADYAARIPAEAAFLLPDVTFDARFESADDMAFFDQESGLFVHLHKGEMPKPGTVRADKLTVPHNGVVYKMETHGGFHGDGSTFYALIIPEEKRADFEAQLVAATDWHEDIITNVEYRQLHTRRFFQVMLLYPASNVDFEWCSFVDTNARMYPDDAPSFDHEADFPAALEAIGAKCSMNWLVALYDADTGLFIYYQYDS
ncbi:MAG: hypothetical protein IJD99_09880 [Clostridia bacterium]|nr:hypothetical protein [Clostridia bacterium]